MNPYNTAKSQGYSDEEIIEYLSEHPDYSEKISIAKEQGYKPKQIGKYLASKKYNRFEGKSKEESLKVAEEMGLMGPSKEQQAKIMGSVMGGLVGAPRGLLEFPGHVLEKFQTLLEGEPNRETWSETGRNIIEGLEGVASYLPSGESIRKGTIATQLADNPELQTILEERPELLEQVLMGIQGGATLGGGAGGIIGGIAPALEEGLESLGASERVKAGAELGLLAAGGLTHKKGIQGKNPQQRNLIKTLKKYGVPEEQIAVSLKKPSLAQKWLAKAASKEGRAEVILNETGKGLGEVFEFIKEEHPSAETVLDIPERNMMEIELKEILEDIPSQQRKVIEDDFNKFMNSPRSGSDMIKLYQDINDTYAPKKTQLQRLKQPLIEGLEKLDPELGSDFKVANEAWSNYKSVRKILKPRELGWLSNLEGPRGIVAAFILGNPLGLVKGLAVKSGVGILAREMVVNPRLKNISQKLGYGIRRRSLGVISSNLKELADEVEKFDPMSAEQIRTVDPKHLLPPEKHER